MFILFCKNPIRKLLISEKLLLCKYEKALQRFFYKKSCLRYNTKNLKHNKQ